jgi:non-lysosomal glucosylceramidase
MFITIAAVSVVGVGSSATATPPSSHTRDFFQVPAAAISRPLGEIPPGPCPAQASQACQGEPESDLLANLGGEITKGDLPMDVTGLRVPVGGVGAGSFMINQAGSFGPWDFGGSQDATWEMRTLPQAAFHVREQVGSGPALVRTLATDGPTVTGTQGPVPLRSWGLHCRRGMSCNPGRERTRRCIDSAG